ncbi:outer membrane protein OmpA-like peptidoglycan-associated protein [Enterobacter sp. BIGb0383]|uniref:OmpA family protein n=1 Tax=unclassified Enterobacter TaxID=2608935 RepID=UPI000F464573|nr:MULTISPECIES: OmpA family protein [unclassified Enterobacter]ROP61534.1 outer membrane protein OmpA-like peptidoglycan-associated protein [Enterobacter sp. BIGb0383]ROS11695.1 outer membrane protein OmpA-like peptidoglycan-associated protein [Enterobacter sp. BIGb0359]
MNPVQRRLLALWAALLSGVVCLGFLPLSRFTAALLLLAVWGVIAVVWYIVRRRTEHGATLSLDNLPEATWRQPVVMVCGDLPQAWPESSPVIVAAHGCWIRIEAGQDVQDVAQQVLWQRPDWGRQLAVMINVCPQQQGDTKGLSRRLLALRWQISQLRRETGHSVPLVLNGQVGSAMMDAMLWQVAAPGGGISVWQASSAPRSVAAWVASGGAEAMQQQVLMNSLMDWFHQHVERVFTGENPDVPRVMPGLVLWGMGPSMDRSLTASAWNAWLTERTGLRDVAGWQAIGSSATETSLFPDYILPLLPEGRGLTPRQRMWRGGLMAFTLAATVALISSGWNNRQLLQRLSFDIQHYDRIPMDDHGPKKAAVGVLRQDAAGLDAWARNGEPLRMGLGLYQGARLRMPVLDAIRTYVPPPPPPPPPEKSSPPVPKIVRLDSMSLFDSGKSVLKTGSTKMLVNSLVGIKARPGWLIVVAGHTDNTGNPPLNQTLSLKRAEAVRDWMRDTGDVPESCFAVQGYGEGRPIATNDTPEGRALNRRVEISLVPQADACLTPGIPHALSQDDDVTHHNME